LAFSVGSACKTPSLLRGAIPVFSSFWLFNFIYYRSINFWDVYWTFVGLVRLCLGQKSYFQCNSSMNYAFLSGVLINFCEALL
jgi:hypothetical protein